MENLKIWKDVPDGSRLQIAVVQEPIGGPRPFVARGEMNEDVTERTLPWTDAQLQRVDPPTEEVLASPNVYTACVRVSFAGTGVAVLHARLIDPNGQRFRTKFRRDMPGNNGDLRTTNIVIGMEQD